MRWVFSSKSSLEYGGHPGTAAQSISTLSSSSFETVKVSQARVDDSLAVLMNDRAAGTLTRLRGGQLRFDYDDAYRERSDAIPLSISMPIQVRSHADRVVTAWTWGLLPDNEAVLTRWARQFHASASSPFSLLATPVGEDCAGAVRFVSPDKLDDHLDRTGDVLWLTEAEVAQRLRELKLDATAWLGRSFTGQFSLAGAQAKTALLFEDGRWGVPSGRIPTSHILKPAVAGLDDHDLNEHLCLDAARRAGLLVARTRIAHFEDESAIVVDRYDRVRVADRTVRVHQEDLCQALGRPPTKKYENEGGPSTKEIVDLFRQAMAPREADDAIWRFVDALAWNWLIAGTDAHAKNYSVLLASDSVRLAPLYDVASALPYGVHEKKLRFAMKLGGHYEVLTYGNPWPRTAKHLGIGVEELGDRVADLTARTPDAFAAAASAPAVNELHRALAPRLVDAVAQRAERCAALLGSTDASAATAD
jgi:serine/threonine-protein kinase HipA